MVMKRERLKGKIGISSLKWDYKEKKHRDKETENRSWVTDVRKERRKMVEEY